jgi:hypothetical protein
MICRDIRAVYGLTCLGTIQKSDATKFVFMLFIVGSIAWLDVRLVAFL